MSPLRRFDALARSPKWSCPRLGWRGLHPRPGDPRGRRVGAPDDLTVLAISSEFVPGTAEALHGRRRLAARQVRVGKRRPADPPQPLLGEGFGSPRTIGPALAAAGMSGQCHESTNLGGLGAEDRQPGDAGFSAPTCAAGRLSGSPDVTGNGRLGECRQSRRDELRSPHPIGKRPPRAVDSYRAR
jgi:hypothetical protein